MVVVMAVMGGQQYGHHVDTKARGSSERVTFRCSTDSLSVVDSS